MVGKQVMDTTIVRTSFSHFYISKNISFMDMFL